MEHKHGQSIFLPSSGYEIIVKPLPPYYKDLIEQQFPLPEYPKRKITLIAGDVVEWPYEPSDDIPEEDSEDYELYIRWHDIDRSRAEISKLQKQASVDYLLSMCVEVVDGEYSIDDENWVLKLEGAFDNYEVPKHKGRRFLTFLKHFVITTKEEMDYVIHVSTSPEVTMQGILDALQGFQNSVE
jgi:hypothetical protein